MKKIGFLSFGHWTPSPQSQARSAADVLLQSIDLAVEAERIGMDGAYFRVHHFARQLASPFPLLAAVGARTRKIEIGTAVIDMRYENPHYMAWRALRFSASQRKPETAGGTVLVVVQQALTVAGPILAQEIHREIAGEKLRRIAHVELSATLVPVLANSSSDRDREAVVFTKDHAQFAVSPIVFDARVLV